MRISQIDILRVGLPFDAGRLSRADTSQAETSAVDDKTDAFNAASRHLQRMETLLVRVSTDDGHVGWGEGFGHLINPVTFAALAGPVGRYFLHAEVTADPASFSGTMLAAHQAFHAFGRTGPVLFALSAIDTALWDLCAQAAGVPLHRLLGAERDAVSVYASLVSYDNDPAEVAYQVKRAQAAGFKKMKLHETTRAAIAAAREALPSDVALMVDVNCPWTLEEAQREVSGLRELSLGWVEEPIWPPDDVNGLAALRASGVPLSAGENASGVQGFRSLFEAGAVDIAQPSVAKIGGISGMLDVIRLASTFDVAVVPHCFYYGAGLLATANLVATLPQSVSLEIPWLQWPEPLHAAQNTGATLQLDTGPGLNFRPDDRVIERYLIDKASLRAQ